MREFTRQQLGPVAFRQGIAAALLIGTVSGSGLGGSAVRAATTGDIALSLQVLLAMTGLVVVLVAVTARDVRDAEVATAETTDADPGVPPEGPDLAGERL